MDLSWSSWLQAITQNLDPQSLPHMSKAYRCPTTIPFLHYIAFLTFVVDTVRKIVLSLLVGYPKWKVRCSVEENFPWLRYQGLSPVGLTEIQEGDNGAINFGLTAPEIGRLSGLAHRNK